MPQNSEMETMTACVPKRRTHYTEEYLPKGRKSDNPTCSQQLLVENWMSEGREHASVEILIYLLTLSRGVTVVVLSFVHSFILSTALQRAAFTSSRQLRYEQAKHVDGLLHCQL